MKKRQMSGWLVAGLLAAFVSSAVAQSATAYSSSAVGVIKKTIPAGKMALISVPLDNAESTNAVIPFLELPFLSSLPNKSTANIWDSNGQVWIYGKKTFNKWSGAITNCSLHSGEAIFLENGGTDPVTIIMAGEVPSDAQIAVALAAASQEAVCANPYPVPFAFTNSVLAQQSKNGAQVNFWDVETGTWRYSKKSFGRWGGESDTTIEPGDGFMFTSAGTETNTSWVVTKPYEWPN